MRFTTRSPRSAGPLLRGLPWFRPQDGRASGCTRQRGPWRRIAGVSGAVALLAGVAACESDRPPGALGYVEGFAGAAVADEPQAVIVARDILSAGGTAADAATAMAFALTVTLPTAASLGGGGVCLVQDRDANDALRVEALDFLPRTAAGPPGPDGGAITVPGLPRGLFALHARDGVLRWETVVSPAETLARQGFTASRALARQVQALGGMPMESTVSQVFGVGMIREGQRLQARDLARALGQARVAPGGYHAGDMAGQVIAAAAELGYTVTKEALRAWTPAWRPAIRHPHSPHWDLFAPVPDSAARLAAQWIGQGAASGRPAAGRQLALARTAGGPVADAGVLLAQGSSNDGAASAYPDLSGSSDTTDDASSPVTPSGDAPEEAPGAAPISSGQTAPEPAPASASPDADAPGAAPAGTRTIDEPETPAAGADETMPAPAGEAAPVAAPAPARFDAPPLASGATGFVVMDSYGGAVACTLTVNRPFGVGRLLPGLGFAPAPMPGPEAPALALMLRANTNIKASLGGFAGTGDDATSAAQAVGEAVFRNDAAPGTALADRARANIAARARLNVISCPGAVPRAPETCSVAVDPRGAGLGMLFGKD